ncbi:hypothetical protein Droror1_Dr00018050 [Drosera rotundifolia]
MLSAAIDIPATARLPFPVNPNARAASPSPPFSNHGGVVKRNGGELRKKSLTVWVEEVVATGGGEKNREDEGDAGL